MSFMDLDATSNKAAGQKDLSPKGWFFAVFSGIGV